MTFRKVQMFYHFCCSQMMLIYYILSHKDIKTLSDTANQELCKVANWLAANKLSLNVRKTHFVIYKAKNKKMANNITINIGNQSIEQVNNTNFLGLNIDQDPSWKHHIKEVTSKISKLSGIMIRARHYLPMAQNIANDL